MREKGVTYYVEYNGERYLADSEGEEKTVYLRLSFDKSSIATPVTNIDLSDSNIIF